MDDLLHLRMTEHTKPIAVRHIFGKISIKYALTVLMATFIGVFILVVGGLPNKWVLSVTAAGCFPLLVICMRSLKRALLALLIISLFTVLDVNPWYSETLAGIRPGFSISFRAIILFILYSLWGYDLSRGVSAVRLFPSVTVPFGIFVVWSGSSILVAPEPAWVLYNLPMAIETFLLFFYTANMLKSPSGIGFIIGCLAVGVALSGILAIYQFFAGSSFGLYFLGGVETLTQQLHQDETLSRVSGLLRHSVAFAGVLSGVLPLLLTCGLASTGSRFRMLCLGSFALGLIALVVTFSRTGWLAFIVGAVLVTAFLMKRKIHENFPRARARLVTLSLATIVLILPLGHQIDTRLRKDDYASTRVRVTLAQDALKIIRRYPLTGVGLGNHEFVIPEVNPAPVGDYEREEFLKTNLEPINNAYLFIAAELGLPALALIIWILIVFMRRGIVSMQSPNTNVVLIVLGLTGGLAANYTNLMFNPLRWRTFAPVCFMGGVLMACSFFRRAHAGTDPPAKSEKMRQSNE